MNYCRNCDGLLYEKDNEKNNDVVLDLESDR